MDVTGIHAPMGVGLMPGVTEADIAQAAGDDSEVRHLGVCTCGCGREVTDEGEYFDDDMGGAWYELRCLLKTFGVIHHDG